MFEFQEKRTFSNFLRSDIVLIIFFVLVLILLKSNWSVYNNEKDTEINKDYATKKLEELKDKELFMISSIEKMNSDIGVEEEIRNRLGFVREGEKMIVIVDQASTNEALDKNEDKKNWWSKLIDFF